MPEPTGQQATPAEPTTSGQEPSFSDVLETAKGASYKVTYLVTGSVGGRSGSVEQTWYVKPPKSRFELAGLSVCQLEDGAYQCSTLGGSADCSALPQVQRPDEPV